MSNDGKDKSGVDPSLFESDLGLDDESDTPTPTEEATNEEAPEAEEPSAEAPVEVEAPVEKASASEEEASSNREDTYVVQKGFSEEGRTFHPGDTIPVKCKYCALWNREWLGKVRCSPGRMLNDVPMSAERFSCEAFFVCKEMDAELGAFLNMSLAEIQTIKRLIPGIKRLLAVEGWLEGWADKRDLDQSVSEVWKNAKGFVIAFESTEQIDYIEHFVRTYCNTLAKREKERKPPKLKYEAGDWVDFTDRKSGQVVSAIILSMGRGLIRLAGVKAQSGQKYEFPFKEWKATTKPKIMRKTAPPTSA